MATTSDALAARRPLPRNSMSLCLRGLWYPASALGFITKHRLWGLTTAAIIINVVLLAALVACTLWFAIPYLQHAQEAMTAWATGSSWLEWIIGWLVVLVWVVGIVLILVGNGLVLLLVGQAVASPFLDMLSERVECLVLGIEPAAFGVRRTIRSVAIALGDLTWGLNYALGVHVVVLVLGLTGIGAPLGAVLSFGFAAMLFAQEFVGVSLARHFVSYRGRWRVVSAHRALSIGFGTTVLLMLAVPGLNLLLLPLATVGGTLAYCDLVADGSVELPKH